MNIKLGDVMKKFIQDVGIVFKNFRKCFGASMDQARQSSHLPKSQFLDTPPAGDETTAAPTLVAGEIFRSFFSCLSNAIEDAREGNHLPKSQFQQMAENTDTAPSFQVSSGLDEDFFDKLIVSKAKLDGSVLSRVGDEDMGLAEAGFEGTIAEELGGRAWDEPSSTD